MNVVASLRFYTRTAQLALRVWVLAFMVLQACGYSVTTVAKIATSRSPLLSSFAPGSMQVRSD